MQIPSNLDQIERDDLDGLLAEVADRCGMDAVRFLVSRFGGATLYVPKTTKRAESAAELAGKEEAAPWLAEVAQVHSLELARALVELRGGEMAYIPVTKKLEQAVLGRKIRRLYNGRNAGELAQRFGLPRRKVQQLALKRER